MTDIKKVALYYCKTQGDDCLCDRTHPGTFFGECIYCFCGCSLYEAYLAGAAEQAERDAVMTEYLAKMNDAIPGLKNDFNRLAAAIRSPFLANKEKKS